MIKIILLLGLNYFSLFLDATKVSIVKSSDVLIQFILQLLILNVRDDLFGILGCLSIIISTLIILIHKLIEKNINNMKK
jgi:hypothetical protein